MGGARIKFGDDYGFIDGSGVKPCATCGFIAGYQCDWPAGRGKTCDLHLCESHAWPIAEDRHLCPIHRAMFEASGAQAPLKQGRLNLAD